MNFLIVDSNRLVCHFLATYLRGKGHAASTILDPSKVMNWLDHNPCDAVILEVELPVIDGITLVKEYIRERYQGLIVIFFTGLGYDEDVMKTCRAAGANGYVSKGLGPAEIYSAIMRSVAAVTPT